MKLGISQCLVYALIVFYLGSLTSGCKSVDKGEAAFTSAEQLLRSGDVPMAIRYYQQAVAQSPEQSLYRQRLDSLVATYVETVKSDAVERADVQQVPAFDEALAILDDAQQLLPEQASLKTLSDKLTTDRNQLLASVERSYDACLDGIDTGDWIGALREARFVSASFPGFRRIDQLNLTIASEGYRYYLDRAAEAFRAQRYTEARLFAKNSLLLNTEGSMVAKQIISDSLRMISDEPIAQQISGYLLTGEAAEAATLCEENPELQTTTDCQLAKQQQISQQASSIVMKGHEALDADDTFAALQAANELASFTARHHTVTWSQPALVKHELLIDRVITAVQQQADIQKENDRPALAWYWLKQLESFQPMPSELQEQMRAQALQEIEPTIFISPFVHSSDSDSFKVQQLHQVIEREVDAAYAEQVTLVTGPVAKELLTSIGVTQPRLGIDGQWDELLQSLNVTHVLSGRVGLNRADEVVSRQSSTAIDEQGNEYPVDKTFVKRVAFLELDLQLTEASTKRLLIAKEYRERASQQDNYQLDTVDADRSPPLLQMATLDQLSAQLLTKVAIEFSSSLRAELPPPLVSAYQRISLPDNTTTMKNANDWATVLLLEMQQQPINENKIAEADQQIRSLLTGYQW